MSIQMVYRLGNQFVTVETEMTNKKQFFYSVQDEIIRKQKAENMQKCFLLFDDHVYEISPSLQHKKITGDEAKVFKREVRAFLIQQTESATTE